MEGVDTPVDQVEEVEIEVDEVGQVDEVDDEVADEATIEGVTEGHADSVDTIVFPKQTIIKLMKEAAPEARFTPEFQTAMNRCCALFLLYISDGAQEVAQETGKKTISATEANASLIESGFAEIAEEVRRSMGLENLVVKKRKRVN